METALHKVLYEDASNHFTHFWDTEMTEEMRTVLKSVALTPLSPQGTVKTIDYLIRKEILSRHTEGLVFCVPILKEWIVAHEGLTV